MRWRRQWHPTPVLLPGKSHGRRSLVGCSPWGRKESDTTERLHFDFSLSCIGEGNGNPLQYSCLENPRDEGAWGAAVYGVAQSWTRLKRLSSSSSRYSTKDTGTASVFWQRRKDIQACYCGQEKVQGRGKVVESHLKAPKSSALDECYCCVTYGMIHPSLSLQYLFLYKEDWCLEIRRLGAVLHWFPPRPGILLA